MSGLTRGRLGGRSGQRGGLRRLVLLGLPIGLLALAAGAAVASGGSSVRKGALYEGEFGGTSVQAGAPETFTVAANGRHLVSVTVFPVQCGVPPGPVATVHNVPIVKGSFKAKYPAIKLRAGFYSSAVLTGHFSAHGRASGREDLRTNDTIAGTPCQYSVPWSAIAEPAGTHPCLTHGLGLDLLVDGTTCAVVDKALDKGKYVRPTTGPFASAGIFTTPGWKCHIVTKGLRNHQCQRSHPKKQVFSFST